MPPARELDAAWRTLRREGGAALPARMRAPRPRPSPRRIDADSAGADSADAIEAERCLAFAASMLVVDPSARPGAAEALAGAPWLLESFRTGAAGESTNERSARRDRESPEETFSSARDDEETDDSEASARSRAAADRFERSAAYLLSVVLDAPAADALVAAAADEKARFPAPALESALLAAGAEEAAAHVAILASRVATEAAERFCSAEEHTERSERSERSERFRAARDAARSAFASVGSARRVLLALADARRRHDAARNRAGGVGARVPRVGSVNDGLVTGMLAREGAGRDGR